MDKIEPLELPPEVSRFMAELEKIFDRTAIPASALNEAPEHSGYTLRQLREYIGKLL